MRVKNELPIEKQNIILKFLIVTFVISINLYAPCPGLCDTLFKYGTWIQLADICLNKANIKEDPESEKEFAKLADILKQKYGDDYYSTLKLTVKDANEIYQQMISRQDADPGLFCEVAINEAKKVFNKFGLKGYMYERVLANVYNKSKFLKDNKEI